MELNMHNSESSFSVQSIGKMKENWDETKIKVNALSTERAS